MPVHTSKIAMREEYFVHHREHTGPRMKNDLTKNDFNRQRFLARDHEPVGRSGQDTHGLERAAGGDDSLSLRNSRSSLYANEDQPRSERYAPRIIHSEERYANGGQSGVICGTAHQEEVPSLELSINPYLESYRMTLIGLPN